MLIFDQINKKVKRLLEVSAEQGVSLSFEQAHTLVTHNPTKQARTLVKLAVEQFQLTPDATAASSSAASSSAKKTAKTSAAAKTAKATTTTDSKAKAPAKTKAATKTSKEKAATTKASTKAKVQADSEPAKAASTKATPTKSTDSKADKPQTFSFSTDDLAQIAQHFLGQDFVDEHNNLWSQLAETHTPLLQVANLCPRLKPVDEPVAFFTELVDKTNRHLKKVAKAKTAPVLTGSELVRVKEAALVTSLTNVQTKLTSGSLAAGSLTEADLLDLVFKYCRCLQVPFPRLLFKQALEQLQTSYPWGESEQIVYNYRGFNMNELNGEKLVELAAELTNEQHPVLATTLAYSVHNRNAKLIQEGKVAEQSSIYSNVPEGVFGARWLTFGEEELGYSLLKKWVDQERKSLLDSAEAWGSASQRRKNAIAVVKEANKLRIQSVYSSASTQLAKAFKSHRKMPNYKTTLGLRLLKAYLAMLDPFVVEDPELHSLGRDLSRTGASYWVDLFDEMIYQNEKQLLRSWYEGALAPFKDKNQWPSIDGKQLKSLSQEEAVEKAMKNLGFKAKDLAF